MTSTTEAGTFPVQWDDPEDAETCWRYDPVHIGSPMPPLEFELGLSRFLEGFGWGMHPRQFNYYVFYAIRPRADAARPEPPTPDSIRAAGRRWFDEVLPEVLALTEPFRTADVASMTNDQLIAELDRLPEVRFRSGQLHTLAIQPHWEGVGLLTEAFKELTGGDDLAAQRLLQGFGNKSFEAGERLWRVGRVAAGIPRVKERLLAIERETALETLAALRGEPQAAPFIEAFEAYLEEFGWRTNAGFTAVPWIEDPTAPLLLLRSHVQTEDYDPGAEQRRLVEEREAAVRETLASLDGDGRARIEDALDAARAVVHLSEDHNFYIDQRLWCMPGRIVREAARRLVDAGGLHEAGDVSFLRAGELTAALRGETGGLAATAAGRREEFAQWRTQKPPPYVGAAPPGGAPAPAVPRDRDGPLEGMGVSRGVVRGPARIVSTLAEADRLRPGDVLVTSVTQPMWTPLFAVARAVVTEVGGMLTHTAVAAREFGIPAIVALPDAMRRIPDGRLIEVDGEAGTVRVL